MCGQERSSTRWLEMGKKTLERGRRPWERGSWREWRQLVLMLLSPRLQLPPSLPSFPSAAGGFLCASSSRRCGRTYVRRSHRRTASHRCECECALSSGRCGWSCACRYDTGRVSDLCGCEYDVSAHQSGRSVGRRSPQGRRRVARVGASCSAWGGICACGWV